MLCWHYNLGLTSSSELCKMWLVPIYWLIVATWSYKCILRLVRFPQQDCLPSIRYQHTSYFEIFHRSIYQIFWARYLAWPMFFWSRLNFLDNFLRAAFLSKPVSNERGPLAHPIESKLKQQLSKGKSFFWSFYHVGTFSIEFVFVWAYFN